MALEPQIVELEAQPAAVVAMKTPMGNIGEALGRIYGMLPGWLQRAGVPIAGPPFVIYRGMEEGVWDLVAGFPVAEAIVGDDEVLPASTPGGKAAMVTHIGPYETLGNTWRAFEEWFRQHGRPMENIAWESYITDPDAEPDSSKWQTVLYWHLDP